jgi:AraC family ethanolamine operon transcriptional activator
VIQLQVTTGAIEGVEDVWRVLDGSPSTCVPLGSGTPRGTILRASIGEVLLTAGTLAADIRARASIDNDRISFSMKLDSDSTLFSFRSGKAVLAGDVYRLVRGDVSDYRATGPMRFAIISLEADFLLEHLGEEALRGNAPIWEQREWFRAPEAVRAAMVRSVRSIVSRVRQAKSPLTGQALRQLQSELVEQFLRGVLLHDRKPNERNALSSATIVRNVENWVEGQSPHTIRVADLCRALRLSRRTLHRAFAETLGTGPARYLARQRLTAVRAELRRSNPAANNVTDTALKYGFWELGRFAREYRRTFGERPSETLGKGTRRRAEPDRASNVAWN